MHFSMDALSNANTPQEIDSYLASRHEFSIQQRTRFLTRLRRESEALLQADPHADDSFSIQRPLSNHQIAGIHQAVDAILAAAAGDCHQPHQRWASY